MGLSGFYCFCTPCKVGGGKELNEEGGFIFSARHSNASMASLTSGLSAEGHVGL